MHLGKKALVFATISSLVLSNFPTGALGLQDESSTLKGVDNVVLATEVADNLFQIQSSKEELFEAQQKLNGLNEKAPLDTFNTIMGGASLTLLAATVYLGWKTFNAPDVVRGIYRGIGTGVLGLSSIAFGYNYLLGKFASHVSTMEDVSALKSDLAKAEVEILNLEAINNKQMAKLRAMDPDIDAKIVKALSDNSYELERFREINKNISSLSIEAGQAKKTILISGFFLGTSIWSLMKISGKALAGTKTDSPKALAIAGTASVVQGLVSGYFFKSSYSTRSEKLSKVEELEKVAAEAQQTYREALVTSLTSK